MDNDKTQKKDSFFSKYWSFLVSFGLISALVIAYFTITEFQNFINTTWSVLLSGEEERITGHFKKFGIWGPLLIILLMTLQMFLIIFPTWLPVIVAVLGYGPVWGSIISVLAVVTASTLGYFIGLKLGPKAKDHLIGKKTYNKVQYYMDNYGFGAVIIFRISPFLSNDAISFIAGIMGMGYKKYMAATLTGTIPLILAFAYFGKDTSTLKTGLYWIGGASIVLYLLYIWFDRKRKDHQKKEREERKKKGVPD